MSWNAAFVPDQKVSERAEGRVAAGEAREPPERNGTRGPRAERPRCTADSRTMSAVFQCRVWIDGMAMSLASADIAVRGEEFDNYRRTLSDHVGVRVYVAGPGPGKASPIQFGFDRGNSTNSVLGRLNRDPVTDCGEEQRSLAPGHLGGAQADGRGYDAVLAGAGTKFLRKRSGVGRGLSRAVKCTEKGIPGSVTVSYSIPLYVKVTGSVPMTLGDIAVMRLTSAGTFNAR